MGLEIITVPCLSNNYAYLVQDSASRQVALVDAPDPEPIEAALAGRGWKLDMILITHHHNDHIAGVDRLRDLFDARVVGAAADRHRLPRLDIAVEDGDIVALGASTGAVLDVPGHTIGHIAYHFAGDQALFSADSLMVMGCGRLFEGTADQMWASLSRMAALPDETRVFSGHEYTQGNVRFALSVDPENAALRARAAEVDRLRSEGLPTVPARMDLERATNPFLRAGDPGLKAAMGMTSSTDAQVFAEIRRAKDSF